MFGIVPGIYEHQGITQLLYVSNMHKEDIDWFIAVISCFYDNQRSVDYIGFKVFLHWEVATAEAAAVFIFFKFMKYIETKRRSPWLQ